MFRIKICGVTNVADSRAAIDAGADAIGLNFFAGSPRFLEPDGAEAISRSIGERAVKVGVFVNSTADRIVRTCERLALDLVQLHGDEPPELLAELDGWPVMRAFRYGGAGIAPIVEYLARCQELDCLPRLALIDSDRKGAYGGTGHVVDWQRLSREKAELGEVPLVLAGGLTAANVGDAIRTVGPAAVDTASGVESAPGRKDAALLKSFVSMAQAAWKDTPSG